jgi:hypothetical protein
MVEVWSEVARARPCHPERRTRHPERSDGSRQAKELVAPPESEYK